MYIAKFVHAHAEQPRRHDRKVGLSDLRVVSQICEWRDRFASGEWFSLTGLSTLDAQLVPYAFRLCTFDFRLRLPGLTEFDRV